MSRPSSWVLLSSAVAGIAYVAVCAAGDGPAARAAAEPEAGPVVVRRAASARADLEASRRRDAALLEGRLIDQLGWPVAGGAVGLLDGDRHAVTDAEGAFGLIAPARRRHRVRIDAPGFEPQVLWMDPLVDAVVAMRAALPWGQPKEPELPPVDDSLLAGEGFLEGEDGQPVAYGVVTVRETGVRATADRNGRYRIPLPDGAATLLAHDESGRVAQSEPVYGVRRQGLVPLPDLTLRPGLVLRGRLLDPDGEPSVGAALRLRGQGIRRLERSAEGGVFAFTGLIRDTYILEALPHRGALGFERQVRLDSGTDLELSLVKARPLRVQVVERGAAPLAQVHVLAEEGGLRRAHACTSADGYATLEGLGPGPFAFEVRKPTSFATYDIVGYEEQLGRLTVAEP
jgi:hypothetical protein